MEGVLKMYSKILVPLDGSETAETVIKFIEELATPPSDVVLVRVTEPVDHDIVAETGRLIPIWEQRVSLETNLGHYLRRAGSALRRHGINVTTEVRFGKPVKEILTAAATHGVDLVAMSSHGRKGLGRLIHGSVSSAVLRESTVPVLVLNASKTVSARKEVAA
jgi:nucleotide-binding universal stress UspA family protein